MREIVIVLPTLNGLVATGIYQRTFAKQSIPLPLSMVEMHFSKRKTSCRNKMGLRPTKIGGKRCAISRGVRDMFSPQQAALWKCHHATVENAHAALKCWIGSSASDLLYFNNAIKIARDDQLARIKQQHAKEQAAVEMRFGSMLTDVMERSRKLDCSQPSTNTKRFHHDVDDNGAVVGC